MYVSFMEDITVRGLCQESAEIAKSKGFSGQTVPEFIALVHSELSEMLEDHRAGRAPDEVYYTVGSAALEVAAREALGLPEDKPLPKCVATRLPCEAGTPGAKPEGMPSELADIVIRVCHFCGERGIDLAEHIREKAAYNRTRAFKHGNKVL